MTKIIQFIKEAKEELGKVQWPDRPKVIKYTIVVIQISLATAIFLGVLDLIFSGLIEKMVF